jgi:two-component system OmpR family response regulator
MRILIIEDDKEVSSYIANGLKEAGHNCDQAFDGKDGLFLATTEQYDILLVDRMLPHVDGLTIIKTLRSIENHTPALILSALGDVDDRVIGLQSGGDDYLVKPFAFIELQARVDALSRRVQKGFSDQTQLNVADLTVDLLARKVTRAKQVISLQSREFRLLEYLLKHKGQVVTRTMLLENVWDYRFDPQTNVIDVHISRLRNKIDKGFAKQLLVTVRGSGYMIDDI